MKKTLSIGVILIMVIGLLIITAGEEKKDPVELALEKAAEEEKLVLLYFTADWCPPCQKMKKEVLPEEAVQKSLKEHYAFVMIDTDKNPERGRKYSIRGIPSMIVLDANGKEVSRFSGFRNKESFIETIEGISEKYWKSLEEGAVQSSCQSACCGHH